MGWLDKIFGSADHRQYGENEYYEYPRNGVSPSPNGGSGSWHGGSGSGPWRGPSIFEDPYAELYPSRGGENSYQGSERSHQEEIYAYRYFDEYGAATEPNSTASQSTGESSHSSKEPSDDDDEAEDDSDGEELSKAMQETLSLQYPPPYSTPVYAPPYNPNITSAPRPAGMSTCAGCNRTLGFGRFLTCLNQNWHPSCFCCRSCRKSIVDREFSVQGNEPYHRDCYKELFHPKCEICFNFIPPNSQGLIEYRSHPFWNQKYCPSHERDGRKRCCSCDRIEPVHARYKSLDDGRRLCSECVDTAVMDTKDCQPLYREILKFYKNLGMTIEQEIPMLLVERAALNHAREEEKEHGHTHAPETRGLCLSEEQTFTTVFGNSPESHGGYADHHETEIRKLTRHCEVTAILVLYGLPRLLTGSILAHELMHAWLRLDGRFPNLENDVEEGICQVVAHIWLKAELEKSMRRSWSGSSTNKRLGEFFLHQIETDSSPVYGDGFRAAFAATSSYGLVQTLELLRKSGNFLR